MSTLLSVNIVDSLAHINVRQTFVNNDTSPMECLYRFPTDSQFVVTGIKATVDDQSVNTHIMDKQDAQHKYDDAIAAGNTAITAQYDDEMPDVINLAIGQLQPGKQATVTTNIVTQLTCVCGQFYSFVFPIDFVP